MTALAVEVEPAEVGFDATRLARIDAYLQRYVDEGLLPGYLVAVTRHGRVAHLAIGGWQHVEDRIALQADSLFRIYSMTKPVTSVAAMMLYEQGLFELSTPVSRFIPSFADVRVFAGGSDLKQVTVPATEPVRMGHLLSHTAGLTYGFHRRHPADALYRAAGFEWAYPPGVDLAGACDIWAGVPLLFQPGAEWAYSVATDVLGRVVEVISAQRLDEYFAEHILDPLGMHDTSFGVPAGQADRLARLYLAAPDGMVPGDALGAATLQRTLLSGGAGLVSSAHDYHRFTQLLRRGGELDGVRLLGPRTLAYMTRNHLPGGADLEQFGQPLYAEVPLRGMGFGLGFSVVLDPAWAGTAGNAGEYGWGGAASTAFSIDPVEQTTLLFFTQLLPSSTHPLRTNLRQLVTQALVD
ncbi:MAG: serine hydrolase [Pseudonocardiales bacterium]|nr:MAG: serine hydrolase [Pseudonocardiales bacterium]